MVQLEEVEDAELDRAQPGPVGDDYDSDDFVDTGTFLPSKTPYKSRRKPPIYQKLTTPLTTHPPKPPDSELSDDDIPSDAPSETITDRLLALRDIVPPRYRRALTSTLSSTLSATKTGVWWGGKGLWVFTTGAIMLSVPFAVCVVEEQQIVEQEREMKAQEGAREVLVPGSGGAGGGL